MCNIIPSIVEINKQVLWKYLYSESSSDYGTLYQLRNRLSRTNVSKKPVTCFNACDDLYTTIFTAHVIAAALEIINNIPGLEVEWMNTDEERKTCLDKVCTQILDQFYSVFISQASSNISRSNFTIYCGNLRCWVLLHGIC